MGNTYRRDPRIVELEATARDRFFECKELLSRGKEVERRPFRDLVDEETSLRLVPGPELEENLILSSIQYASRENRERKTRIWMRDHGITAREVVHEDGTSEILYFDEKGERTELPGHLPVFRRRAAVTHRMETNFARMIASRNEDLERNLVSGQGNGQEIRPGAVIREEDPDEP